MTAKKIIDICERLYQKDLLAGADGNVSILLEKNKILITPSGKHKAFINPTDMVMIDFDGKPLKGKKLPSSEYRLHVSIYKNAPAAKCVIHAHLPYGTAWTIANPHASEFPVNIMPEVVLALGRVPIAPYATPGTDDMANSIIPFLPRARAMLLSKHGGLSWGEDLDEAYNGIERIEHIAKTVFIAKMLGMLSVLPEDEIQKLEQKREMIGPKIF